MSLVVMSHPALVLRNLYCEALAKGPHGKMARTSELQPDEQTLQALDCRQIEFTSLMGPTMSWLLTSSFWISTAERQDLPKFHVTLLHKAVMPHDPSMILSSFVAAFLPGRASAAYVKPGRV